MSHDEIFISDGSKCDTGNILDIFGADNRIAVQDPVYPVYVDTNVMAGHTGPADAQGRFARLVYLPCTAENNFTPDLPREKVRYHTCYGINMGPRTNDMEVKHLIDIILAIKAGAFSFEASNPRHEHEWTVWRDAKKPDGTDLLPPMAAVTNFTRNMSDTELRALWTYLQSLPATPTPE